MHEVDSASHEVFECGYSSSDSTTLNYMDLRVLYMALLLFEVEFLVLVILVYELDTSPMA
jgi:hypothetical protein